MIIVNGLDTINKFWWVVLVMLIWKFLLNILSKLYISLRVCIYSNKHFSYAPQIPWVFQYLNNEDSDMIVTSTWKINI